MKAYIGKNRAEVLDSLVRSWLKEGPSVCFLQGFSGVGKTDLARDFSELAEQQGRKPVIIEEIADRPTPSVLESLMELSAVLSQHGLPDMEQQVFEQVHPQLGQAVELALQNPVVIVLDEAQRLFRAESGAPLPEMNQVLSHLRIRPNLPGRLLLLSDRLVEEARWSEWILKKTLEPLKPDEAVTVLNTRLHEAGVEVDIAEERKAEVVQDLDYNPRAIEALVGALRYDTLDEIIESNPGLWAVRDREVSREFLKKLERDLLERTMRHLDPGHLHKLWRLAVHRRSFKREALERLCGSPDEAGELRNILATRFLLNIHRSVMSLNPLVREISLAHLREEPGEFRQAHSSAADYHLRHFKAKQIVGSQAKLGESFAELRYHLVQSDRADELTAISHRFTDHLKQEIKSVSPVPTDPEELDERIAVLTVLLGDGGAKGLEYHLARCLYVRGRPEDLSAAVRHAQRAVGPTGAEHSWFLLAKLTGQTQGVDAAVAVLKRGIGELGGRGQMATLYQLGSELLANENRVDEAVSLLREGIKVIPPNKNLASLYQIGAGLLAKSGRNDEAISFLREGIKVIPPDKGLVSLYQIGADLLAKSMRNDEAGSLFREGIKVIPPDKGLSLIYQTFSEVYCRAGQTQEALSILRDGVERVPSRYGGLRLEETLLYLSAASGEVDFLAHYGESNTASCSTEIQQRLAIVLWHESQNDWSRAIAVCRAGRRELPTYLPFAAHEALAHLAVGEPEQASEALATFPNLRYEPSSPLGWLKACIDLDRNSPDDAAVALEIFLGRPADRSRELNRSFLLRLWDEQEPFPDGHRICFHFPLLPPALTGLDRTVGRIQFGPPVLSLSATAGTQNTQALESSSRQDPDVYVSYAWGEDSTEAGRQREEIVDRLCDAVRRSGREIGRDKERMRGGDSIERFAQEISKSRRIIAVISEKSLHSRFCLAHELFRAFRRCDYQRHE
ncbi:MAG: AAA family ATPase, partial [Planctomycetaceae bacterium]|nr:AAA family ATPase [Planctomycetaceae bacterium]